MKTRIVVIGLDGATFDVIDPMVRRGWLPNIARLMRSGVRATLRSTIHPITPQAWSTFLTGKNAGKHAVFDFTQRKNDTYDIEFVNAGRRRSGSVLRYLSEKGVNVGAVAVPFTYPPEEVKGFMLSGFDAPGEDERAVHPPELYKDIRARFGQYYIHLASPVGRENNIEKFWRDIQTEDTNRTDISLYLMERSPSDLFMVVYNNTDRVQHQYLTYELLEALEGKGDEKALAEDLVVRTYKSADEQVGRILEAVDRMGGDTLVMLMSDHGSGPIRRVFRLNRWLEERGLLSYRESSHAALNTLEVVRRMAKRMLPRWAKTFIKQSLPGVRDRVESFRFFNDIDWAGTRAYGFGMYGNVYVNLKGREPQGTVDPADYERVCAEIAAQLLEISDPDTGEKLVERVYRKQDLYTGPHLEAAPDLLIGWKDYSYYTAVTPGRETGPCFGGFLKIDSSDFEHVGTHRVGGVFVASGHTLAKGRREIEARLIDLAPTMLYALGHPVPRAMDGKVLLDLFSDEFRKGRDVEYTDTDAGSDYSDGRGAYSDAEAEKVEKRLKGLGYL
jgi:predicted AlkP superfamily phosphohydrolase/phosphomutase